MTDRPPTPPGAWEELERRRVVRVACTYIAVTFAVLSVVGLLIPTGGDTDTLSRVLLGAAVLGFPVVILLAWLYDVTPDGIVRTPDDAIDDPTYTAGPGRRWLLVTVVAAIVGAVVRFLDSLGADSR